MSSVVQLGGAQMANHICKNLTAMAQFHDLRNQ